MKQTPARSASAGLVTGIFSVTTVKMFRSVTFQSAPGTSGGSVKSIKLLEPKPMSLVNSVVLEGDVRTALARLPSDSVQCVVTSPPYWGLRDYGIEGQIGLEGSLSGFIRTLTGVFAAVRRILKPDGILWLNIGDGYTSGNRGWRSPDKKNPNRAMNVRPDNPPGLKDKDLIGIPWRLAFALQDEGWFLRTDIVWHKPNVMPESVKDRPTRAHEFLFMLTKSEHYTYHGDAVKEPAGNGQTRNRRTVWSVNTCNSGSSHIASFPQALVEPCILASTKPGDFVLDPFFGSGTVGVVAQRLRRRYVGIELNPGYVTDALAALSVMPADGLNFEPAHEKNEYEFATTLLEPSSEYGVGTGSSPASVSPGSPVEDHRKPEPRDDKQRARCNRKAG